MTHQDRLELFAQVDLYVVITAAYCAGRSPLAVLDACLDAGVKLIQLREKRLDDRELYERAKEFGPRCANAGAMLLIDDRLDIALAAGADGVHLGQRDLPVERAREIAPDLIIGASTHSIEQALAAQAAGASYVNLGPIYETQTKETNVPPLGPEIVTQAARSLRIPFTCMGGIKEENVSELTFRGASHIAVVTAVTETADVREAALRLRERIRS